MSWVHDSRMDRAQLPLNALRAFEASARHLNFTRAALELRVTQGAVSHQVAALEARLGAPLFRRLPRGLALTDEGHALVDRYAGGRLREVLTLGVVGTFATGWLLPRVADFTHDHPHVDLRIMTNNNRVDLAGEGLDLAIRFGDGAWHGTHAVPILAAPLTPLCTPAVARRLGGDVGALARETLLRSYRPDEWARWFALTGEACPPLHGPIFDSAALIVTAAIAGHGIALVPPAMFAHELTAERLVRPFTDALSAGGYWLTRLKSRRETPAMRAFASWLVAVAER
jgi:LysR family transcriptional regulator of beta-lactamase